ncbi:MAG: hypothetical protein CVU05_05500 [Bacteroidetes bacterium HGW-Bacteroidetes-21]|jgi:formylglycine-generating enzyme required for sulfatase activity|nr:MAG: hypothetical protein CVU05_05500 [Bacteroidetes bacterium HGW-Bacteroidetes-21]
MKNLKFVVFSLITLTIICLYGFSNDFGKAKYMKSPEGFVFVPQSSLKIDEKTVSVAPFFISKTEVTNQQYRTFLCALLQSGDSQSYRIALPDTLQWRDKKAYNEPYVELYFRHPAYANYPVVNVSYEGALLYCQWLTKEYHKKNPNIKADFRLPAREEWVLAAKGGNENAIYPWNSLYLRDAKGTFSCNFKAIGSENISFNASTQNYDIKADALSFLMYDNGQITVPVESYKSNNYGVFNMSGNVAEMCNEKGKALGGGWNSTGYDVRIESVMNYEHANVYTGFRPVISFYSETIKK